MTETSTDSAPTIEETYEQHQNGFDKLAEWDGPAGTAAEVLVRLATGGERSR